MREPIAVSAWLAKQVGVLNDCVTGRKGVIDLVSADHCFASFGAARPISGHRRAAVCCANSLELRADSVGRGGELPDSAGAPPGEAFGERRRPEEREEGSGEVRKCREGKEGEDEEEQEGAKALKNRSILLGPLAELPVSCSACSDKAFCGDFGSDALQRSPETCDLRHSRIPICFNAIRVDSTAWKSNVPPESAWNVIHTSQSPTRTRPKALESQSDPNFPQVNDSFPAIESIVSPTELVHVA
eukprot:gene17272-biopygen4679